MLSTSMLRVLAVVFALAACTSSGDDSPTGKIVSASVGVQGGTGFMVAVDATLTGPYADGAPVWTSQYSDVLEDTTIFDTLALSAGDQVWHSGTVIHFVDTRTAAPAAVVARCGTTVRLSVALGAGVDGIPGTAATSDVTIDCH